MIFATSERRLWSLQEMIVHHCFWMCEAYRSLDMAIDLLTQVSRGFARMDAKGQRETARIAAQKIVELGNSLGWQLSDRIRAEKFLTELSGGSQLSSDALVRELDGIRTSFHIALQTAMFAYVPAPDDKYFENDKLFGDQVFSVFEESREDLRNAGNCLALGLYTACVFHLMRVSEHGLRRLVSRLRVTVFDKGKPQRVEYATWQKMIDGVHSKITEARKLPAGPKKQAQLSRFSDAGDHCTFMKDIWRNDTSHARKPYNRDEALAAFGRVNDFMNFIAKDVK